MKGIEEESKSGRGVAASQTLPPMAALCTLCRDVDFTRLYASLRASIETHCFARAAL